jgi:hypothetical protein
VAEEAEGFVCEVGTEDAHALELREQLEDFVQTIGDFGGDGLAEVGGDPGVYVFQIVERRASSL